MKKKALQVKTQLEIAKHVHQVFEAIVDPEKMLHYFISSGNRLMFLPPWLTILGFSTQNLSASVGSSA